ncbi:hypothetical protein O6H91_01G155400 [Diphasiastrum complanatum]|uniref:Uncharacterized protein n=1 Tax=Diphasiastrum complanatum TaxID=34168 RepID=A0ACC2EXG9_DIPCM|nr:hypothetical protein O6H91_01G155400 [Diphasiastrum complanatum]
MGVKGLAKLLAAKAPRSIKEQKLEDYAGRSIAIDASLSIYQFLTVVGRKGAETLTNEAGEVTRTNLRLGAAEELAKALESQDMEDIEKYSKRVVQVMPHQNEDIDKLLQLMGVPLVKAPSEAEAECAALCKLNKAFAVASEDMDSLSFGAPRLVRYLLSPVSQKLPIMEYDLSKVLEELKLSLNQFVDLCILAGCDYIENIKGIGPQTALKLVQKYGSIEVILENLNKDRYTLGCLLPSL